MTLLILSADDVSAVSASLTPNLLLSLMALVFVRVSSGSGFEMPQRSSITTNNHNVLFMPATMAEFGTSMKVVAVPQRNQLGGIPAATLVLDDDTGVVKAVVNARGLTALRTAAGSALATRLIGPTVPHTILVFGAGKQIEAHTDLLLRTFPSLRHCIIVNRSLNLRLTELRDFLAMRHPLTQFVSFCAEGGAGMHGFDLQHAVTSADIICTATSSTKPLFKSRWVKVGTHINLVGSYTPNMVEVEAELIKRAGKILVDSRDACLLEAGELIKAKTPRENIVEVGEVVAIDGTGIPSEVMKVRTAGDITIFKSVGVGLQDTAITSAVVEQATSMSVGTRVNNFD